MLVGASHIHFVDLKTFRTEVRYLKGVLKIHDQNSHTTVTTLNTEEHK